MSAEQVSIAFSQKTGNFTANKIAEETGIPVRQVRHYLQIAKCVEHQRGWGHGNYRVTSQPGKVCQDCTYTRQGKCHLKDMLRY